MRVQLRKGPGRRQIIRLARQRLGRSRRICLSWWCGNRHFKGHLDRGGGHLGCRRPPSRHPKTRPSTGPICKHRGNARKSKCSLHVGLRLHRNLPVNEHGFAIRSISNPYRHADWRNCTERYRHVHGRRRGARAFLHDLRLRTRHNQCAGRQCEWDGERRNTRKDARADVRFCDKGRGERSHRG